MRGKNHVLSNVLFISLIFLMISIFSFITMRGTIGNFYGFGRNVKMNFAFHISSKADCLNKSDYFLLAEHKTIQEIL